MTRVLAGAACLVALVLPRAGAQQPPPPPRPAVSPPAADSLPRRAAPDTVRGDSVVAAPRRSAADTIKQAFPQPPTPRSRDIGGVSWHWDRDRIFSSGALTLGELLAAVPGVTWMTTGFISAPQVAAWLGDAGRTRLFVDGIELDAVNARNGGITDMSTVPMWAFEDVQVERAGGELRVHLRTWTVGRTTPYTRTDVLTGSENLNLYRGFFGRRLSNGAALQAGGQQFGTLSRGGADGDGLSAIGRVGWAGRGWSIDGVYLRSGGTRNAGSRYLSSGLQANALQTNALPPFKGSESMAYLRVGLSDPSRSGLWAQLIASTIRAGESRATTSQSGTSAVPAVTDSVDTTRVRSQYVATVGANVGSLRLSATGRFRSIEQKLDIAPSVRAEYDAGWFGVGVHGEKGVDSTLRTDVQFRLTPTDWFHVGGAASRQNATSAAERALTTVRAEAALQWRGRWLGGGWLSRSQSLVSPPVELDSDLRSVRTPAATAITLSLRAPLFSGWSADVDAINWDAPAAYRPQTQTRSSLRFESSFLGSFPRGNFHLLVAGFHEYRSTTFVPKGADPTGQSTPAAGSFSSQLEIRIGTATISWQARNLFGTVFETYPGYVMPRITNIYGVRWEFWN